MQVHQYSIISTLSFLPDESREQGDDFEQYPSWDNGSVLGGQFDDGVVESDDESSTLVSQPRQVGLICFCFFVF